MLDEEVKSKLMFYIADKNDCVFYARNGRVYDGILTFGNDSHCAKTYKYRKSAEKRLASVNYRWSQVGPFELKEIQPKI